MVSENISHVIFDVDGLLLDTERLFTVATQTVLKTCDAEHKFTWDVKKSLMGMKHLESVATLLRLTDLEDVMTVDQFARLWDAQLNQLFTTCDLMPGAERLVPIAICTGSQSDQYKIKIAGHRALFDLFDHAVLATNDPEVQRGKPDPQCYQVCMRRFDPVPQSPAHCLVFEDAPNGVQSATAAGMQCVMVPDPRASAEDRKSATLVLSSLDDFKPEEFGLPAFD